MKGYDTKNITTIGFTGKGAANFWHFFSFLTYIKKNYIGAYYETH